MSHPVRTIALIFVAFAAGLLTVRSAGGFYNLPPQPQPHAYGNVLINRGYTDAPYNPVVFRHWVHRLGYTCGTCHVELEFEMAAGGTGIDMDSLSEGKLCGSCHDGDTAFNLKDNCNRCHSSDPNTGQELFDAVFSSRPFPATTYGNGIDWVESLRRNLIAPVRYLQEETVQLPFDKLLMLRSEMARIPQAIFPHRLHTEWVGCDSCHPAIFNIKAKTTRNFRMGAILHGEFCGVCHLRVAFPMTDCGRCHPGVREIY